MARDSRAAHVIGEISAECAMNKLYQPCCPRRCDGIWRGGLALILGLALFTGCKKSAITLPPPDVETVEMIRQDAPVSEEWVGRLDGFVNADIRAQVSGYLLSRDYKEGEL